MDTSLTTEYERRKQVRLRVRADLQFTPQKYEGRTCHVVKDPVSLRYYRFNEQEQFVVERFNGKYTLEETQKAFEANFRPHRLTLEDLEAFSQQLLTAGLVQHESPNAGKTLYDKRRKQNRMQRIANLTNILYIKLPIFDPDKILKRMLNYTRWIFTFTFFVASLTLMASAIALVLTHYNTFYEKLPNYQQFFRFNTLMYLWISLGIVKVIHEFGHGLSCKAFGGECHEMGALFLCFSPCLYCNVSDSWTIPDKWKRIIISFAGIYVELVIAALATWVWWYTPGRPLLNNVALCVMVLCSVSTVVFNANPLMRFDGYYMLADFLEIPNLRDRANRTIQNMASEFFLGMEVQPEPYMEPGRLVMFLTYAIGSYIYRWVVTFSILYFLSNWLKPYKLGALSGLLALAAAGSMVGWPLYRMVQMLLKRGRFPDMKRERVWATSVAVAVLVALFFFVPLPISRVRQVGLVQLDRDALSKGKVVVPDSGILERLYVRDGQTVQEGQLLAEFRNLKQHEELAQSENYREIFQADADASQRKLSQLTDPDERKQTEGDRVFALNRAREEAVKSQNLQEQIRALREIRSPCAGIVMGGPKLEDVGKLIDREGDKQPGGGGSSGSDKPLMLIGDQANLVAVVPVGPDDYHLLQQDGRLAKNGTLPATVRVSGRGMSTIQGVVRRARLPETDAKDVPLALTHRGGGPLATKAGGDPRLNAPQSQQYLVEVELLGTDRTIVPGTTVSVKVHCQWRSAAWWVYRKISSAFDLGLI